MGLRLPPQLRVAGGACEGVSPPRRLALIVLFASLIVSIAALILGIQTRAWGWISLGCIVVATIAVLIQHRHEARFRQWLNRPLSKPSGTFPNWQNEASQLSDTLQRSRQAEKQYIDRLRTIRNSANKLPDACVVIAPDGRIEELNLASSQLLGLDDSDINQYFGALIRNHELNQAIEHARFDEAIEFNSPINERLSLEVRLIPLDDDRLLLIVRDVTQLNKLLSMRQDFIANVSHELRTPLTILLGYIEALTDGNLDETTLKDVAKRLSSQSNRMKLLVEDLLTLTQLESRLHPAPEDIASASVKNLVANVVTEAEQLSAGNHRFTQECDEDLIVDCVEDELQSAILNLLTNAIRYSPNGGEIVVRWNRQVDNAHARFEVKDRGLGIAAEHLPRITERFYRVPSQPSEIQRGTGLGLAIVKHVLLRHGCTLQVESTFGHGSRFFFDFPLKQNPEAIA